MQPLKPMTPMEPMAPMQFDDPVGDVLARTPVPHSPSQWSDVITQRQQNGERLSISAHVPGGDPAELLHSLQQALGDRVGPIELRLV